MATLAVRACTRYAPRPAGTVACRSGSLAVARGGPMSYGIVLAFEGVGSDQYWAVNEKLGIKPDGTGDWPAGIVSRAGGPTATGWVVTEIWNSKADQEAFMGSRLGAALAEVGLPAPSQIIESELVNYQAP